MNLPQSEYSEADRTYWAALWAESESTCPNRWGAALWAGSYLLEWGIIYIAALRENIRENETAGVASQPLSGESLVVARPSQVLSVRNGSMAAVSALQR